MTDSEFDEFAAMIRTEYEREIAERGITEDTDPAALAFGRKLVETTIIELRKQQEPQTLH